MTEPIKLPPLTDEQMQALVKECGLDWQRGYMPLFDDDPTNRYAVLIEAAVEQATAELRAANEALGKRQEWWNESLFRVQQALDKALAERDEARAELARLTTLRPYDTCTGNTPALYWAWEDNEWVCDPLLQRPTHWTPLPPVKEADR